MGYDGERGGVAEGRLARDGAASSMLVQEVGGRPNSLSSRSRPAGVALTATDPLEHLARRLARAHYQGQHCLAERNHELFVAILGTEEDPPAAARGWGGRQQILNQRMYGAHRETRTLPAETGTWRLRMPNAAPPGRDRTGSTR